MKPSNPRRDATDALPRLTRLFKILTVLNSRLPGERIGRQKLADACESSVITVQRDIELLTSGSMAPVDYDPSERTYKIAERGWKFPVASWTAEDALALSLARGRFPSTAPHAGSILRAFDKIAGQLSPALQELVDQCAAVLQTRDETRDYSGAPIAILVNSAIRRETVEIDYESQSSGRGQRLIDPYKVEETSSGMWYAHSWCHRNKSIRSFALDRIHEITFTGKVFERREDAWNAFASELGVHSGLRGEATTVDLLFDVEVASYARRTKWGDGLSVVDQPDGTVRVTGIASGTAGILPEILRWRRLCEVVGGPELRQIVIDEIEAMAQRYKQ